MSGSSVLYDIEKIKQVLPHRYPFLLVDRILDVQLGPDPKVREGRVATAVKCVTYNEPFFQGHFPHLSIMPGVLLIEAIAQAGALAYFQPDDKATDIMIASVSDAKFRKPVVPGDQLEIKVEIKKDRGKMILLAGEVFVEGQRVAEANVMAYVVLSGQ